MNLKDNKTPHTETKTNSKADYFLLSVITPAYNEAENLPIFYKRLRSVLDPLQLEWEWIVVDDHSKDETFQVASELAADDSRIRVFRFSRNFGSHMALRCGFDHSRGACVAGLAADLQDPPEVIPALLEKWTSGNQVVWAARGQRPGESQGTVFFSHLYYFIMRRLVGFKEMSAKGADFFLLDRRVVQALRMFPERNNSLFALVTWMGFRQEMIVIDKQERLHGSSGWSLEKKLKVAIDALISFSYQPIRIMSLVGFILAILAFVYLAVVVINGLRGISPQGWASLMVAVLFVGGLQIMMMGVLGEYIWRSLDEARNRPSYIIEDQTNLSDFSAEEKLGEK